MSATARLAINKFVGDLIAGLRATTTTTATFPHTPTMQIIPYAKLYKILTMKLHINL